MRSPQKNPELKDLEGFEEILAEISSFKETIRESYDLAGDTERFLGSIDELLGAFRESLEVKFQELEIIFELDSQGTITERLAEIATAAKETEEEPLKSENQHRIIKKSLSIRDIADIITDDVIRKPDAELRKRLEKLVGELKWPLGEKDKADIQVSLTSSR
jgi:hypothetical protein